MERAAHTSRVFCTTTSMTDGHDLAPARGLSPGTSTRVELAAPSGVGVLPGLACWWPGARISWGRASMGTCGQSLVERCPLGARRAAEDGTSARSPGPDDMGKGSMSSSPRSSRALPISPTGLAQWGVPSPGCHCSHWSGRSPWSILGWFRSSRHPREERAATTACGTAGPRPDRATPQSCPSSIPDVGRCAARLARHSQP